MKNIYWKIIKLINPDFIKTRNAYIQSNINYLEGIRKTFGNDMFNQNFGIGYIETLKKDLV